MSGFFWIRLQTPCGRFRSIDPEPVFSKYHDAFIEFIGSETLTRCAHCACCWFDDRLGHFCAAVRVRPRHRRPGRIDRLGYRRRWHADAGLRLSDVVAPQARSGYGHLCLCQGGIWRVPRLCFGSGLLGRMLSGRCCVPCPDQGDIGTVLSGFWRRNDTHRDRCGLRAAVGRAFPDSARHQGGRGAKYDRDLRQTRADTPFHRRFRYLHSRPTCSS